MTDRLEELKEMATWDDDPEDGVTSWAVVEIKRLRAELNALKAKEI